MTRIFVQIRTFATIVGFAAAAAITPFDAEANPALFAQMQGRWTATLEGNTGCGSNSLHVIFALDAAGQGTGTATITSHSTGCPDGVINGQDFNITSLNAAGRGRAGLSCGVGCGWSFRIQVAEGGQSFILTDVDPANPLNTPTGAAIHVID